MNTSRLLHDTHRTLARKVHRMRVAARKPATVHQEMRRGAAFGSLFALGAGVAFHLPLIGVAAAMLGGICAGGVIGLVLWSGSPSLPEDRVLPPPPGQERRPSAR